MVNEYYQITSAAKNPHSLKHESRETYMASLYANNTLIDF